MEKALTFTMRETKRITVLALYQRKAVAAAAAAERLGISLRHFWRLWTRYRREGEAGLLHRSRGRPSPRRAPPALRAEVIALARGRYAGFNDVHFTEKLRAEEGIALSRECVRGWLRAAGVGPKRRRRPPRHRSRREPCPAAGMMVQLDASSHDWLAGRGPRLTLLAAVDDATKQLLYLHFEEAETTAGYLRLLTSLARTYGLPMAVYADRHTIFQTKRAPTVAEQLAGITPATQLGRALAELGVEYIAAHSPQAKGRIERVFGTLQDRLVAELRLARVTSRAAANRLLPSFRAAYNRRFAVPPRDSIPAWVPLPPNFDLDAICCVKFTRTVKPDNTLSCAGRVFQLPPTPSRASFSRARVDVHFLLSGETRIFYHDHLLARFPKTPKTTPPSPQTRSRYPNPRPFNFVNPYY